MRVRLLPLVVVACLVTAGCTNAYHSVVSTSLPSGSVVVPVTSPTPTSNTASAPAVRPAVPADVPTTGPNLRFAGERPPVMPVLASQHTQAGAVAFAIFFIKTIDWGFATTSSAYMNHYFVPSCSECTSYRDSLDLTAAAKERYVGGRASRFSARVVKPAVHAADEAVVVTCDVTSAEALTETNKYVNAEPAHTGFQSELWLTWIDDRWHVAFLEPPS